MGQYYTAFTKIDGEYNSYGFWGHLKLMEHSWWKNDWVNLISESIYHNRGNVAWIGDYAEEEEIAPFDIPDGLNRTVLNDSTVCDFTLNGKFLVNHTKGVYLDCTKYYNANEKNDWCIHPLPLLTAVGNGRGGGDYWGFKPGQVGVWAWNELEVTDAPPSGYKEVMFFFSED